MKDGEIFVDEYEKLLSITGKNKLTDITKVMKIDINNKKFWKELIKTLEDDIEQFMKLSRE